MEGQECEGRGDAGSVGGVWKGVWVCQGSCVHALTGLNTAETIVGTQTSKTLKVGIEGKKAVQGLCHSSTQLPPVKLNDV